MKQLSVAVPWNGSTPVPVATVLCTSSPLLTAERAIVTQCPHRLSWKSSLPHASENTGCVRQERLNKNSQLSTTIACFHNCSSLLPFSRCVGVFLCGCWTQLPSRGQLMRQIIILMYFGEVQLFPYFSSSPPAQTLFLPSLSHSNALRRYCSFSGTI